VAARQGVGGAPALGNALEVWARVLSTPEPGRVILSAGKRDLSFDIDLPVPERWFRPGLHDAPQPIAGWHIGQLSDQHAFALGDPADDSRTELAAGDMIALGISHPCTTFDKWPVLLEVDADYAVVGALRTFF
jgi:D-serine dehydratase